MTTRILTGDCRNLLATLEAASARCCVTSPPYFGLRDYGVDGQIGLESTVDAYVAALVEVFREVRRVLTDDGTLWLNLGDSYCASPPGNKTLGVSARSTLHGANGPSENYRKTLAQGHATKRDTSKLDGLKHKDLIGVPWRVAFALQADGWWLRQDIIWAKPNPMPESVRDRCTKSHEYLFLLSKSPRYYFDATAIAEPATKAGQVIHSYNSGAKNRQDVGEVNDQRTRIGIANWSQPVPEFRNRRDVWTVTTKPFSGAHFAVFPPELIEPCVKAGSAEGDTVLDPFGGAGTTGLVADRLGRNAVLVELNPDYVSLARNRIIGSAPLLTEVLA